MLQVVIQKSGSGGVYVGAVTYSTSVTQSGKGVTAITSTDTVHSTAIHSCHVIH